MLLQHCMVEMLGRQRISLVERGEAMKTLGQAPHNRSKLQLIIADQLGASPIVSQPRSVNWSRWIGPFGLADNMKIDRQPRGIQVLIATIYRRDGMSGKYSIRTPAGPPSSAILAAG